MRLPTSRSSRSLLAALLAASAVVSCDSPTRPPTTGRLVPQIVFVRDPANTYVIQQVTSMNYTLFAAGTTNIIDAGTLQQNPPPTGPWEAQVRDLAPGDYTLAIEGRVGGLVQHYGTSSTISIVAGRNNPAVVPVAVAVPTTAPTLTNSNAFTQIVNITPIAAATGYQWELADNSGFTNATGGSSPTASFTLPVTNTGTWFVRTRPTLPAPAGTVIWSDAAQFTVNASVGGRTVGAPISVPPALAIPDTVYDQNLTPSATEAWYSMNVRAGDTIIVSTVAEQLVPKSTLNTVVDLFRADGTTLIANSDNVAGSTDSRAVGVAPATELVLARVSRTGTPFGHFNVIFELRRLPAVPTGFTAVAVSNSTVDLSWTDNADNEQSYRIERCSGAGCSGFAEIASTAANAVSFSDPGHAVNEVISYRIRARNAIGNSNYAGPVTVVIAGPNAPSALTATTISGSRIDLAWTDNSNNETQFRIERCALVTCTNGDYVVVTNVAAGVTTYADNGLAVDGTYTYRVRADNNVGVSAYTTPATANTIRPSAPSALAATTVNGTRIDLTWTDGAVNETGYRIERCATQGCSNFAEIAVVGTDAVSYSDVSAAVENFYTYRVRAYNVAGTSAYSNLVNANTRTPGIPASVAATTISATRIDISWADTTAAETGFLIERCATAGCSSFTQIGAASANATVFQDNAVSINNEYSYRIRASGVAGNSAFSLTANANTQIPAAPTGLAGSAVSATQVNLTWTDAASNEAGFRIERCTNTACSNFALLDSSVASNVQAYSDLTAQQENVYRYRIAARNPVGLSAYTAIVTVSTETPAAPSSLTATTISATRVDLSWAINSANETGFAIDRCTGAGCSNFQNVANVAAGVSTYQNNGVTAGNSYTYRVRATNIIGSSAASNLATAATTVPSAPSGLAAATIGATRLQLTWTDNSSDETSFQVERCAGAGCSNFGLEGTVGGGVTTWVDSTVAAASVYTYRVRAFNVIGGSAYSATALGDLRPPADPTNLIATTASATRIDLTWTDASGNETSFEVQRCTSAGCSSFAFLSGVATNSTTFSDNTATVNESFSYRIRALNAAGGSNFSNTATATTLLPVAPSGVVATTLSATQVKVDWVNNAGDANGFIIQRCTGAACSSFADRDSVGVGLTTFTDPTTTVGNSYTYRVLARNLAGRSVPSGTATTTTIVPNAPSALLATTQSNTRIDLAWTDGSSDETGFYIERCQGGGCSSFAIVDSVAAGVVAYQNTGLTGQQSYSYRIRAYNAAGPSTPSNTASATTNLPAIPTGLLATATSTTQVQLAWTDNATDETSYDVQRCAGGGCTNFATITTTAANAVGFTDTGLSASTTYRYQVRAVNGAGSSDFSNTAQTTTAVPADPTGANAVPTSTTTATVSWEDNADNEVGYQVERCQGAGCSGFALVGTVGASVATYNDAGLSAGQDYSYRIRAINAVGNSGYSNTATISTVLPAAPSNLTAQTLSSTEILLAWDDNSTNESGFEVQRCQGGACTDFAPVDTVVANTTGYDDAGLPPNTTFRYRVRAVNGAGVSAFTAIASASTDVPADPTGLGALAQDLATIRIDWNDNATNEDGYVIQRCAHAVCTDGDFSDLQLVGANVSTYTDASLAAGDTASYRVKAINANGESRYSNVATAWTRIPDTPTALTATMLSGSYIDVTWADQAENELYYEVERCAGPGCSVFTRVDSLPANATVYGDGSVTTNQVYTYRVRAVNLVGVSGYSGTGSADTYIPAAPSNLVAVTTTGTNISLTWTDNSNNETNFRVERCTGAACVDFDEIAIAAADDQGYDDAQVVVGNTYRYRVIAFRASGTTVSNIASSSTVLPADPMSLSATVLTPTSIRLTWADTASNEAGFRIERCTGIGCSNYVEITQVGADVTQFDNTGLATNTFYRYRVRAYNSAGVSGYTAFVAPNTFLPGAPTALVATMALGTRVDLTWSDNANNETGYRIERCLGAGCTDFAEVALVGVNAAAHADSTLAFDNDYRYRIRAYNGVGNSAYSNIVDGSTHVPLDPSALTAEATSTTSIHLGWTDNATNETGFRVERCATPGCSSFAIVATLGANVSTYDDAGIASNTSFTYRVRAFNNGQSGFSNTATATTILPADPDGASATAVAGDRIDLAWTDHANNEYGYRIERCTGAGCSNFVQVAQIAADAQSYSDLGLPNNQLQRYRVRAYNGAGNSGFTAVVQATTNVPGIPTVLTATTITASRIDLAWTDNASDELGFVIERCTGAGCSNFTVHDSVHTANATGYQDTGLPAATAFRYRVRTYNAAGVSGVSNLAAASTNAPADPTAFTATTLGATQVELAWNDESDNELGFRIERCTGVGCTDFALLANYVPGATLTVDNTVTVDNTYRYRIRAFNNAGVSNFTAIAEANTLRPAAPTGLNAITFSATRIDLTWADNADNETAYSIERCVGAGCSDFTELVAMPYVMLFQDEGLTPSQSYSYRVRATNISGASAYTAIVTATTAIPADPSATVATTVSASRIDLTWTDNSNNELGFVVERCTDPACTDSTVVGNVGGDVTGYSDQTVSLGNVYYYRVKAQNAAGISGASPLAEANTQLPADPLSLEARIESPTAVRLDWNYPYTNERRYVIDRCAGAGCSNFVPLDSIAAPVSPPDGARTYTDATAGAGAFYTYRVRATNAAGTSGASNATETATILPTAPAGLTALTLSESQIALNWADNSFNERGFLIERCEGKDCSDFTQIDSIGPNETGYQAAGLTINTFYGFRVRAVNPVGASDPSDPATATTLLPAVATALTATNVAPDRIDIAWSDNADNEEGYRVERCAGVGCTDFVEIVVLGADATGFANTGLTLNTAYSWRVRPYNAVGPADYSNEAAGDLFLPATPVTFAATPQTVDLVDLTWGDAATNETQYVIESCVLGAGCPNFTPLTVVGANSTAFGAAATAGNQYLYRIRAFRQNVGASAAVVSSPASTVLNAPVMTSARAYNRNRVDLVWQDNSTIETGYDIYACGGVGCATSVFLGTQPANSTTFSYTGLASGFSYSWAVRARSNATVTALTPPAGIWTPQIMTNGVAITGITDTVNAQRNFVLAVPAGVPELRVVQSLGSGDPDLYLREGLVPTFVDWNCRPYVGGTLETCSIQNPNANDWFSQMQGFSSWTGVQIKGSLAARYGFPNTFAGTGAGWNVGYTFAEMITVPATITLSHIGITTPSGGGNIMMSLYNNRNPGTGNEPSILLAQTSGVMAPGMQEYPIANITIAPGTYWIVFQMSQFNLINQDTGGALTTWKYVAAAYGTAFPASWPVVSTNYSRENMNLWIRGVP